MTEEEAKKKWCPWVQFVIGPNNSTWQNIAYTNRATELNHNSCCCLGPDCMMWIKLPENLGGDCARKRGHN